MLHLAQFSSAHGKWKFPLQPTVIFFTCFGTMPHSCDPFAATHHEPPSWIQRAGVLRLKKNGASIMMRRIAIGLAAALIATGGATLTADAHGGGYHGGSHYSHGGHYMKGGPRGEYGHRYGYKYRPEWRHHRYEPHWGGYYERRHYGGGSCWRSVWTPDGWQRQWVCGGGYGRHPYGAYGYYRGWGGHHHMRYPGHHGHH
jgi:hypothetical protein